MHKFASVVIFKPNCSKILWSSFLVLYAKCTDLFFIIAKLSSLYRPMFLLPIFRQDNISEIDSELKQITDNLSVANCGGYKEIIIHI